MSPSCNRSTACHVLACAIAVASAPVLAATSHQAAMLTPGRPVPTFQPCTLGTFVCAPRPISYAQCRPNALFAFYDPALPRDSEGRQGATTHVNADRVQTSGRDLYHLDGNVSLERYDELLKAEHVDYNNQTTAYDAHGNVTLQNSSTLLAASRIHGSTTPEHVQASDVRYQLLASRGNGTAAGAQLRNADHGVYTQATYSTCDPGHHVWQISAKRISTDKVTGEGTAHDATLRLGDVPLLYLPYFTFPIDNRRKSGFLYPTFSGSGNSGFMVSVPYYLNLAPNYDATLTPQIYTERGVMLGGQFRYLLGTSRGQFDIDYLPNDRHSGSDGTDHARNIANGADRYLVHFNDTSGISDDWSFSTSYQRASDKYYFQDFQASLAGYATPSALHSNAYLHGNGNWWSASLGVDDYQNVDPVYTDANLPYKQWPRAAFDIDVPLSRHLTFGMSNEAVAFRREDSVEGDRVDIYPWLQADFQGPAWFVRPRLGWRYTRYRLINDPAAFGFDNSTPTRSLPIASIDSGLIFERDAALFGHAYTQTLEPRLYYLYVPYRDQQDLPLFDSRVMQFAWWQLFSPNRFSGTDRQMNANNLTAAITSRLLDDNGVERASVSFGQIRYFTPQRVQLDPGTPATDFSGSAYVTQMGLSLNDNWRVNTIYQWDPNDRQTSLGTLQMQRRLGSNGILNFAYRYSVDYMEQFDTSAVIPLNARWRLLGRWNLQLRDSQDWQHEQPKTLAALFGVEYDSCCVAVRLLGRHYVKNVHGDTDNAIMLQVQLKGLGSFSPQTEQFLHHAILGYQ